MPRRAGRCPRSGMKDRRIVIVGFMGSGKTTVARALAQKLGCDSMDLDSFIAEREARSPAQIIQQDGEAAFREIETRALRNALENSAPRVIALGGGTWTIEDNRALVVQSNCLSVWLDAPFELCWERIVSSTNTIRPMAPDRESSRERYAFRRASYSQTDLRVTVSDDEFAETLANKIIQNGVKGDA